MLKAALELRTADWRDVLRGPHILQARTVLQHIIDLPIRIHNEPKPKWIAAARPEGLLVGWYSRWRPQRVMTDAEDEGRHARGGIVPSDIVPGGLRVRALALKPPALLSGVDRPAASRDRLEFVVVERE